MPRHIWDKLPEEARQFFHEQQQSIAILSEQVARQSEELHSLTQSIQDLQARLGQNSKNSSKPPSSDPPFNKPPKSDDTGKSSPKKKRGAQKGHKGHSRKMLPPTRAKALRPSTCRCGCAALNHHPEPFYIHQVFEIPDVPVEIIHYQLHAATCSQCGTTVKGHLPVDVRTGYGPRFSAAIAYLSGVCGESREAVAETVRSFYGVPISTGAVQRVIDRASAAIEPIYDAIGAAARTAEVNHVDETSWFNESKLRWLWVMASARVAFFKVHKNRSYQAFLDLIAEWVGILVSDDYALYKKWVHLRQTCLAHLIRKARGFANHPDPEIAHIGKLLGDELSRLCDFAKHPPNHGQWTAFYARFVGLLNKHAERKDKVGTFVRRLASELADLWVFLHENGVEPTNNRAERALRYAVIWRKRSLGTWSEKGDHWVERILSLKHTCRQNDLRTYPILVQALSDSFACRKTDVAWVATLA